MWLRLCSQSKCGSDYSTTINVAQVIQQKYMWLRLCRKRKCHTRDAAKVNVAQVMHKANLAQAMQQSKLRLKPDYAHPA